ncbi:MAG: exopolysaccharide biosynthesis polyprenyl glycosylphosphotransferase [Prevotellaceae bacterium]|nr:exopolysaccharide biosynthesis polyprenyl glycosylphosphotransferase [Prevotellaceae bacterium]
MRSNNLSNNLIKWAVIAIDFIVLLLLIFLFIDIIPGSEKWDNEKERIFWMICITSLMIAEYFFSTRIHFRSIGADDILKRSTMLALTQTLVTYLLLRAIHFMARLGWQILGIGISFLLITIVLRLFERWLLKKFRSMGYNTRFVTLVGSDKELERLYKKLIHNASWGYKLKSFYGSMKGLTSSGSIDDFIHLLDTPEKLRLGDELFLSVSRKEKELIERTARLCEKQVVKFYYVPMAEETLNLQPALFDEQQVFTTYTSPLEDPLNKMVKRLSDIVMSLLFLIPTAILLPLVALIIKIQSPGPIFFRQRRTGLEGHDFYCYKFRSMHVNKDADQVQATKNDPRKFAFGNLMRKTNIDELPQFWNVLRGDMSIVGPRPHMLAHTKQYSELIDKYMVRHFVKAGVTGWAQVTGFRGETQHQWQMEGRVERDIWYIQNWSIWLDIRIIWMTIKTIFSPDAKAY